MPMRAIARIILLLFIVPVAIILAVVGILALRDPALFAHAAIGLLLLLFFLVCIFLLLGSKQSSPSTEPRPKPRI